MAYKLIVTIPDIPPAWVFDRSRLASAAEDGLRGIVRSWLRPVSDDPCPFEYDIVHVPDPIKAGECVRYAGSLVNVLAIDGQHAWVRWASFVNGSGFLVDLDKLSPRPPV